MSTEQKRSVGRSKKDGVGLEKLLQGLQTKTTALMVEEIARARVFLKSPLTTQECEAYLKQSPSSLVPELQSLMATVELRWKTEQAEFMRRCLGRAEERDIALDNLEEE